MRFLAIISLATFLGACTAYGQDSYDLVILNGRVMDPETEFDAVRNVGIRDGRIKRGELLVFAALGGGLAWGSTLVRY